MKRLFNLFLAIFFPWILMLLCDNLGRAIVAIFLQASLIGWPVATIWAWRTRYPIKKNK